MATAEDGEEEASVEERLSGEPETGREEREATAVGGMVEVVG